MTKHEAFLEYELRKKRDERNAKLPEGVGKLAEHHARKQGIRWVGIDPVDAMIATLSGLLRPDEGSITLFGNELNRIPEEDLFALRARTGMVFQEGALFDSLTIRDNVAFQLIQEKVDVVKAAIAGLIGRGLSDRQDRPSTQPPPRD